ncbi:unnamed protein product [Acanthosepion pharaonis]|uniref:Uncharacterized protein n=1 Tax=Acanthosepion pharaonis TaxID=158019 RepID=A0A812DNR2_ACAPH|nr:unnamed protein product [Sepia pharaonis]
MKKSRPWQPHLISYILFSLHFSLSSFSFSFFVSLSLSFFSLSLRFSLSLFFFLSLRFFSLSLSTFLPLSLFKSQSSVTNDGSLSRIFDSSEKQTEIIEDSVRHWEDTGQATHCVIFAGTEVQLPKQETSEAIKDQPITCGYTRADDKSQHSPQINHDRDTLPAPRDGLSTSYDNSPTNVNTVQFFLSLFFFFLFYRFSLPFPLSRVVSNSFFFGFLFIFLFFIVFLFLFFNDGSFYCSFLFFFFSFCNFFRSFFFSCFLFSSIPFTRSFSLLFTYLSLHFYFSSFLSLFFFFFFSSFPPRLVIFLLVFLFFSFSLSPLSLLVFSNLSFLEL